MSHSHTHSHQHHGLEHTHDHHHGPSGEWTDDTAHWYAEKFGDWPSQRLLADHLALEAGTVVVDVGCGTGAFLRALTHRSPGVRPIGVDGTGAMVGIARTQCKDTPIALHVADARALPLEADSVDVVVFLNTLHHVGDTEAALTEAARVLRPGGVVWVGTDEDVYDMAGWSNGRVRDELSAAGFGRIRQTSLHEGDVVLNLLSGRPRG